YQAQADAAPIARVLLTGGSSRLPNLGERLGEMIGIPVEQGHPLLGIRLGRTEIPQQQLIDNEPLLAVPIGLALARRPPEVGRRRLTLLPPEMIAVREQRQQSLVVVGAVGALAAALLALWFANGGKVDDAKKRKEAAQAHVAQLQTQVGQLSNAAQVQAA